MKRLLALASASILAAVAFSAHAATVYTFDANAVGAGNDAYAAGFTGYNIGGPAPATVAGVTFSGTSGVDDGAFGFPSDGTQSAFLQSFTGLTDGSIVLGTGLTTGATYDLSFSDVARPSGGLQFTVSQGDNTLGTFTPGAAYGTTSLQFVSNGDALTFAAVHAEGDHSTALDNVSISAAPEPGVWMLMISGLAMIGGALRLRRRQTGFLAA